MAPPAGPQVNILALSFTLVSGIFVFFRLFTRFAVARHWNLSDACIGFAMACSIGLTVAISVQVQNGLGQPFTELSSKEMIDSQKAFWVSIWMDYMSLTFTKVAILMQYLRSFPGRRFQIICFVILGVVIVHGLWGLFGTIFLCSPVHFFWDKSAPGGECLDQFAVWFANASLNIGQNFVMLLLPMPVLRKIKLPSKQKRALMMVFALGAVVCIISVVRLQTLISISNSTNPTYDNRPAASLSTVETNLGIITACLPALRPLLSALMSKQFPRTTASHSHDEEQPKFSRTMTMSASTPPTSSIAYKGGHSRNLSGTTYSARDESEMGDLPRAQPTFADTGIRVLGPVRQVHIRSPSATASLQATSKLPQLPESVAGFGSLNSRGGLTGRYRSFSSPLSGRAPLRTPMMEVELKPLPLTPFPVVRI